MVQITPFLFAITVFSQFTPSFSTSNGLTVRQTTINTGSLPSSCQSPCQVLNTMSNCDSNLTCFCATDIGSELQQCMSCLVKADTSVTNDAESSISDWNMACGGDLSLSSGSGSGSGGTTTSPAASSSPSGSTNTPNQLGTNNSVSLKAGGVVVCIVAAFAGAFVSL